MTLPHFQQRSCQVKAEKTLFADATVLFAILLSAFILLLSARPAQASGEDFYWKNSYGRGVGIPLVQYCQDSSKSV
jgi:hypothetical protein